MFGIRGYDEYFIVTTFSFILYCGVGVFVGEIGFIRHGQKQQAYLGHFVVPDLFSNTGRTPIFKENY